MNITISHDKDARATYIKIRETQQQTTRQLDNDVLVDIDSDGQVIGIEINDVDDITTK